MEFDLVLAGGTIVDGTGATAVRGDVGVAAGRIAAVGDLAAATAAERIDATGLAITPGFIDAHAHSDLAPFLSVDNADLVLAPLRQGVTTEVCGNCGESPFPRTEMFGAALDRAVAGLFADTQGRVDRDGRLRRPAGLAGRLAGRRTR